MITVEGLHKKHGTVEILKGVSLTIAAGETAAIVGPSGSGKSTLLRCINGMETFHSGVVHVGERVLTAGVPKSADLLAVRRQVGMVFQQYHLFGHLTVLENVMTGPRYVLGKSRAEAEPIARKLLDRVGLAEKSGFRIGQLSGGQQQRVAIARSLAVDPKAILFDEPTSALDPHMADEVFAVIADLAREGRTMVVVTHAVDRVRSIAQTVHVMQAGQLVRQCISMGDLS